MDSVNANGSNSVQSDRTTIQPQTPARRPGQPQMGVTKSPRSAVVEVIPAPARVLEPLFGSTASPGLSAFGNYYGRATPVRIVAHEFPIVPPDTIRRVIISRTAAPSASAIVLHIGGPPSATAFPRLEDALAVVSHSGARRHNVKSVVATVDGAKVALAVPGLRMSFDDKSAQFEFLDGPISIELQDPPADGKDVE